MYKSLLLFVVLLFVSVNCSKLVYVEIPNDEIRESFIGKFANAHDVRGDYGNFLLVVDHGNFFTKRETIVYGLFNDTANSYFVAEAVDLSFTTDRTVPETMLPSFTRADVLGKYVFEVPKAREEEFVGGLPFDYEFVLIPTQSLPAPFIGSMRSPMAPDPKIQSYIAQVNSNDLKFFTTYLSGENSSLITRHSQSTGNTGIPAAQTWLQQQFTSFGFTTTTQAFRSGYASNVVATLIGKLNPKKIVLVTAHYDDRGPTLSSTTQRAPGANDNGSGTGALLQIAKLIYTNKITFNFTVILIAFAGEEQGLYGSAYSAQQYRNENADIEAVLNADMIAYRSPSESPQLAFASRSSSLPLNALLTDIAKTYVTGLTLGTSTACCTDHSSFYNQGFAAASYFERNGAIADPQYHQSGDLVNRNGYDLATQYPLIVRAMFAGLLTIAKYLP